MSSDRTEALLKVFRVLDKVMTCSQHASSANNHTDDAVLQQLKHTALHAGRYRQGAPERFADLHL